MALAGDHDVIVAVGAQLDRTPGMAREQRCSTGEQRRLRFLAAKAAAHAPALDRDARCGQAQRLGHLELHLARMLRRVVHAQRAVFDWNGVGDLAFKVKLFLAAETKLPLHAPRCGGQRGRGITARKAHRGNDKRLRCQRIINCQQRGQVFVDYAREARRAPRRLHRVRGDDKNRLAEILHLVAREDGVIVQDGAEIVLAGDIGREQHRDHAGCGAHRREIDGDNARMRALRQAEGGMQRTARLEDVIDIRRRAGDVQMGAVVAQRRTHPAEDGRRAPVGGVHVPTWLTRVMASPPAVSR